jgi:hypothetical protein
VNLREILQPYLENGELPNRKVVEDENGNEEK